MIQQFNNLTKQEASKMLNAIPLITILIAGADDKIDYNEKKWANKLANIRTFSNPNELHDYYSFIGIDFAERLNKNIDELPNNTAARQQKISEQLAELNTIFPKLDSPFGPKLYASCLSFAKHVANASGGFLGFNRISKTEKEWITLPMLEPVLLHEEEEEGEE
ncbi:MAG: hypothetical protein AB8H03_20025 [Saprospiraceae bacterium]